MAHEFESGFMVEEPAWHGLGIVLPDAPATADEAIKCAGLDWEVTKKPLISVIGDQEIIMPDNFSIIRNKGGVLSPLGVVGNQYTPVQNAAAFRFFDQVIATGGAQYHTAGSLRGGKIVWILAKIGEGSRIVGDDRVDNYILLFNSHDGTYSVTMQMTPIRVVCANTLGMAVGMARGKEAGKAAKRISVRHTVNAMARMGAAAEYLGYLQSTFEENAESFRFLASKQANSEQVSTFLNTVFGAGKEEPSTRAKNIMAEVEELATNGTGMEIAGEGMNYWKLYNGVTEYIDYKRGGKKTQDDNLNSSWFGQGATIKEKALETALLLAAA